MGAPGYAYICARRGHLYHWIEEHLWWGSPEIDEDGNLVDIPNEPLREEARRAREDGCPCGEKKVFEFCHYGRLNDCICLEKEVGDKGILQTGEEILRVRIPEALDASGNPIEAYRDVKYGVYDFSRVDSEILRNCRYPRQ
ncbi:MAG: hypothetical protein COV69_00010 [Parcubacteria group bacterium CG11_big_fil_rev_8_21_14_0_20_39_14]|nr:MAG: hypothetical protein COV69_00010 [Parcubacteria group bacterium CG11_big_fil_rev_8_21_14_0_20_39_14]